MAKFTPGTYEGTASGNGYDSMPSRITVSVTLSEDRIEDVKVLSHAEIKGVGCGLKTSPIETIPAEIVKHQSLGVPPTIGAEKSAKGIIKAATKAIAKSGANTEELMTPVAMEAHGNEERTVDFLVVGGGAGGLAAGVEARQAGGDVLIVEAAGVTGGSAARSGGKLMAPGTKWQAKVGILDTPDMMYEYLMAQSRGEANPQKIRYFADNAYGNLLWLEKMGYEIQDVECIHESILPWRVYNSLGGHYMSAGQGGEITSAMHHEYERLGGEFVFNCSIKELIEEKGVVTGAIFTYAGGGTLTVHAKNVLIATGGFARDRAKCEALYPLKNYYTDVPKTNNGKGINVGVAAGAKEVISDGVQVNYMSLSASMIGINEEAGLILDAKGNRVVNEWSYQYVVGDALRASGSNHAWYVSCGNEKYDSVNKAFAAGPMEGSADVFADTIEELAGKMGVDAAVLKATIDRYNELADKGHDDDFGKPAEYLFPVKGPKYVAFYYTPCVTVTYGGMVTDLCARVLDKNDQPIPGLFATGEAAPVGIYGTVYPGCGTSIGTAVLWGRVAARLATGQSML
ncbi:MAG: FAD-dependent oxidoreductase [Oscillospiraceae bacterium]